MKFPQNPYEITNFPAISSIFSNAFWQSFVQVKMKQVVSAVARRGAAPQAPIAGKLRGAGDFSAKISNFP
jgi:hypothetical protein